MDDDPRRLAGEGSHASPRLDRANERALIEEQLRARAGEYWGHAQATARLGAPRIDDRSSGRLYWYAVTVDQQVREVVVKVVEPPVDEAPRLRLAWPPDMSAGLRREFDALRAIDSHFVALRDPRIGNVPVLDRIEGIHAIVFERVAGDPLTGILDRHHRLRVRRSSDRIMRIVRHAGAWLAAFHSVEVPHSQVHRATRDEFVAAVERYCAHLAGALDATRRFRAIEAAVTRTAEGAMPSSLPIAVAHSDYAKRNLLVQADERVVAIDTLARRHAPIFEDLASFTVGSRFGRLQLRTYGLAFDRRLLAEIDDAFLGGYFDPSPVPDAAFRTYEVLMLLDRWAAVLTWSSRGPVGQAARRLASRLLDREIGRALSRLG